eukprot:jgi/Chlat1/8674/Chrsp88S08056
MWTRPGPSQAQHDLLAGAAVHAGEPQCQLTCSRCRTVLVYPRGASNVLCVLCNTVTAVPGGPHRLPTSRPAADAPQAKVAKVQCVVPPVKDYPEKVYNQSPTSPLSLELSIQTPRLDSARDAVHAEEVLRSAQSLSNDANAYERMKRRRRETAQRSRARKAAYMRALEIENATLRQDCSSMRKEITRLLNELTEVSPATASHHITALPASPPPPPQPPSVAPDSPKPESSDEA